MSSTKLVCSGCQTTFERATKEVTRQRKKHNNPNMLFYCSSRCHADSGGKNNLGKHLGVGKPENLPLGSETDEFSPYRVYLKLALQRKDKECDLDLPYLQALWASQQGKCGMTGVPLDLPQKMADWTRLSGVPTKPSLDRIDGLKGYVKGNVRYVSVMANLARSRFSDKEVIDWCLQVARHHDQTTAG